jgi:hypothetical protein
MKGIIITIILVALRTHCIKGLILCGLQISFSTELSVGNGLPKIEIEMAGKCFELDEPWPGYKSKYRYQISDIQSEIKRSTYKI